MNPTLLALIHILADGEIHSGEELGQAAGVSRAAVWKQLKQIEKLGISIISQKASGYRIPGGLSLLRVDELLSGLSADASAAIHRVALFDQLDSTNGWLLKRIAEGEPRGLVCLAEQQTAGRGRRGRVWVSPFAANLYLSVGWRFSQGIAALEGLSLAVGIAVCDGLQTLGYPQVRLKWPNDLLVADRKLGGILVEIAGDASGECAVVIGLGLNVRMPSSSQSEIDQPWTDLASLSAGAVPDRNGLVTAVLDQLMPMLDAYEDRGFGYYRERWESMAAHLGSEVVIQSPSSEVAGTLLGVTDSGGLRLQVEGGERIFLGGEVSLRAGHRDQYGR